MEKSIKELDLGEMKDKLVKIRLLGSDRVTGMHPTGG